MYGRSSFLLFLFINFVILQEHRVSSLHCHKCDTEQDSLCSHRLGSHRYLQLCKPKHKFCEMVWKKDVVKKRGCTLENTCPEFMATNFECCACKTDGCNWGEKGCNAQAMLYAKCLMILASQVLVHLLKMY